MLPALIHNKRDAKDYPVDVNQIDAYDHLRENPRAGLFYEMGLSKTVVALTYLHDMHYQEVAINRTLVVAPDKVARITWPDEIETWAHLEGMRYSVVAGDAKHRAAALEADAEVFIIGVDNLAWLIDQYVYQRRSRVTGKPYGPWFGSLPFDCIVIDEISLFKSWGSERYKKLRRALDKSDVPYRIGLTGTPMPGGYIDLWAQLNLLDDGRRLGQTVGEYIDKFFSIRGNGMIVHEYRPRAGAPNVIAKKIQDIVISRKWDKAQLPPCHTDDVVLEFSPQDRKTYDDLEEQYVLDFFDNNEVTVKTAADLTNKLLQVSGGAVYLDGGKKEWRQVGTTKLDALRELLNTHADENFIVVYQFQHEKERILSAFPFARELRRGARTCDDMREWNDGKIRLLLLHPASAGHGLNLQHGGRRLVWFSLTWNLEHYLQTVARLWRRGQPREVWIHRLMVRGTRDSRVRHRLASKDSNQTFLMNEIKDLRNKYYGTGKTAADKHKAGE